MWLLLILLVIAGRNDVWAEEYYVTAKGAANGGCGVNDPCTFDRAQTIASTGDVLVINGRIGAISITKSGLTIRGGVVDGSNLMENNASAVMVAANDTILEDVEIVNGWATGFRTKSGTRNLVARRLNVHHNVRQNFAESGGCLTNVGSGWGAAMRAYFAEGVDFSDSYVWENCGEGFSAVMSNNVRGNNLVLWDNWSVNAYPDQTKNYSLTNSSIYCVKPEFQRSTMGRSILFGAEEGYGPSTTVTRDIVVTNNKIYSCKGVSSYQEVTGSFANVLVANNDFYNIYGPVFQAIPGTNVVTSPNKVETLSVVPTPPYPGVTITPTLTPTLIPTTAGVVGDANSDGMVDLVDFEIWKREYLGKTTSTKADFNRDGKANLVDFAIWKRGYLKS